MLTDDELQAIEQRFMVLNKKLDLAEAEIERLNKALDEITTYIPATIDDNDGNPRVSLFSVHRLQAIACAAREKRETANE